MPRFQCPKAETRKIKHLQPLILPHNRTPIETHTHTQKIFKQNIPKGGFKLRKSWIHAKSYCGVRFGLTCSLLLKIYSLSERPIDCPLHFPRLLFFFFFFFLSCTGYCLRSSGMKHSPKNPQEPLSALRFFFTRYKDPKLSTTTTTRCLGS